MLIHSQNIGRIYEWSRTNMHVIIQYGQAELARRAVGIHELACPFPLAQCDHRIGIIGESISNTVRRQNH